MHAGSQLHAGLGLERRGGQGWLLGCGRCCFPVCEDACDDLGPTRPAQDTHPSPDPPDTCESYRAVLRTRQWAPWSALLYPAPRQGGHTDVPLTSAREPAHGVAHCTPFRFLRFWKENGKHPKQQAAAGSLWGEGGLVSQHHGRVWPVPTKLRSPEANGSPGQEARQLAGVLPPTPSVWVRTMASALVHCDPLIHAPSLPRVPRRLSLEARPGQWAVFKPEVCADGAGRVPEIFQQKRCEPYTGPIVA